MQTITQRPLTIPLASAALSILRLVHATIDLMRGIVRHQLHGVQVIANCEIVLPEKWVLRMKRFELRSLQIATHCAYESGNTERFIEFAAKEALLSAELRKT